MFEIIIMVVILELARCRCCGHEEPVKKKQNKKIPSCDLCKAEKQTTWHYSCNEYWIAECRNCGDLIIVYRYHQNPTEHLIEEMKYKIGYKAEIIYGVELDQIELDVNDKGHWNCHARMKDGTIPKKFKTETEW